MLSSVQYAPVRANLWSVELDVRVSLHAAIGVFLSGSLMNLRTIHDPRTQRFFGLICVLVAMSYTATHVRSTHARIVQIHSYDKQRNDAVRKRFRCTTVAIVVLQCYVLLCNTGRLSRRAGKCLLLLVGTTTNKQ